MRCIRFIVFCRLEASEPSRLVARTSLQSVRMPYVLTARAGIRNSDNIECRHLPEWFPMCGNMTNTNVANSQRKGEQITVNHCVCSSWQYRYQIAIGAHSRSVILAALSFGGIVHARTLILLLHCYMGFVAVYRIIFRIQFAQSQL